MSVLNPVPSTLSRNLISSSIPNRVVGVVVAAVVPVADQISLSTACAVWGAASRAAKPRRTNAGTAGNNGRRAQDDRWCRPGRRVARPPATAPDSRGRGVGPCVRSDAAGSSGDRRRLNRPQSAREGAALGARRSALVLSITSHLHVFARPAGRCSGIIPPSLLPSPPRGRLPRARRTVSQKCQKSRAVSIIYCRPPPVPASNLALPGASGDGREGTGSAELRDLFHRRGRRAVAPAPMVDEGDEGDAGYGGEDDRLPGQRSVGRGTCV